VTVNPSYKIKDTVTIKHGETYTFGGKSYSEAGDYLHTFKSQNGCDSVVDLHLAVKAELPTVTLTAESPVCEGEPIEIIAQGVPSDAAVILTTPSGSTVTKLPYTVKSAQKTDGGKYSLQVTLSDGTKLQSEDASVTVNPSYKIKDTVTIKQGEAYTFGGKTYGEAGDYQHTFKSQNGCDSVVNLHLAVKAELPTVTLTAESPVCEGEPLEIIAQGVPSDATVILTTPSGATVNKLPYTVKSAQKTDGGKYILSVTLSDGTKLQSEDASVTVNPSYKIKDTVTIKHGETYTFGGKTYSEAGDYQHTFKSQNGCDSVVNLHLAVKRREPLTITVSNNAPLCQGGTLKFEVDGALDGFTYKWSGPNYFVSYDREPQIDDVTLKEDGFYSLIVMTEEDTFEAEPSYVDILPTYSTVDSVSMKEGEQFVFGSQNITESGEYNETFTAQNGCDSVVTVIVSVKDFFNVTVRSNGPLCEGDKLQLYSSGAPANADYSWTGPNGFVSDARNPELNNVTAENDGLYFLVVSHNGEAYGQVETFVSVNKNYETKDTVVMKRGDSFSFADKQVTDAGDYQHHFVSAVGCDSVVNLNVIVEDEPQKDFKLNISGTERVCEGGKIYLNTTLAPTDATFEWIGPDGFKRNEKNVMLENVKTSASGVYKLTAETEDGRSKTEELNVTVNRAYSVSESMLLEEDRLEWNGMMLSNPGVYKVVLETKLGCDSVVTLNLKKLYRPEKEETPESDGVNIRPMPSLSPDGDGQNDLWQIEGIELYPNATVEIYDRNGKLLLTYKNYDNANGWDGTYNGHPMPSTDYWYVISIDEIDKEYYGHFTLLRQ
jgi:gliding motility-associated-like protein